MRLVRICDIVKCFPRTPSPVSSVSLPTRLPPLPGPADPAEAPSRALVVAAIVLLHAVAVWALLQVQAVREAAVQAAPILVSLLAAPQPPSPPPAVAPAARPQPRARPQPKPQPPVIALPQSSDPQALSVPPPLEVPPPAPAATVPQAAVAQSSTDATAPAAPPPAPKQLPDDAVQYLQPPQLLYPPLSLRRRETGLVVVRAYVGLEGGAPRSVSVERSSGHARLDQAAMAAVQGARFKPYAEKGRPVEGWALIPIRFDLEK